MPFPPRPGRPHSLPTRQGRCPVSRFGRLLAAVAFMVTFASGHTIAAAAPAVRNIVLVHGPFVDGSSWQPVITRLQHMGYHVTAVQNPLTSLDDDVAATENVLRRQTGDVLLVGHSWAGAVITQAGNAANVKGLVYLSALAPDDGESVDDLLRSVGAPMTGLSPDARGLIWLDDARQFQRVMAGDLPFERVNALTSTQQPIAAACFAGKVRHAAWHDKPRWYLRTTDDNALEATVQQAIAQRIGATVTTIRSSHLSMLSHPDDVARLIDRAARTVHP
ncbi:alpha/beta hydrolase [Burkholderia cenocepacia]|uniref:Putative secreted protein n=1 Tax=Burkholderia orbicola (strain AU 1054) TaxID=331271 RepID=A0A0H2XNZ2_BURO1|nr:MULTISPECIES: alpha/beta hydrolase [Burkholderia cepacia complex]MBJ9880178.1 alpha/beta hydrolase [Burkholderia cenocepacia]MCA8421230.1 alpha/beta hydrolase [Burkholderia cenocepacia]MDN7955005.1 alpha/beta hydrolase [Burkholderia orbicola]PNO75021.1 alpha/beta hydrolase [Burkholderia cenocepacia]QIY42853.1 alpha/beta hydrolase [Burkholderia cenocepacia]